VPLLRPIFAVRGDGGVSGAASRMLRHGANAALQGRVPFRWVM